MQHEQEQRARLQMEQIARDEDRAVSLLAVPVGWKLTFSANWQLKNDVSSKKALLEVKVLIAHPLIGGEHMIERKNSRMIVGIVENNGLLLVEWPVETILTIGQGIQGHINILQSIHCSSLRPTNRRLPLTRPKFRLLLIGTPRIPGFPQMSHPLQSTEPTQISHRPASIGDIARLRTLRAG
jgi:hypothetical protein